MYSSDAYSGSADVLSQMAVTVNHEINNPLMGIVGNLELALRDVHSNELEGMLRVALKEAFKIKEITHKLVKIKTVVSKPYVGNCKMIDLDASIR